MPDFKAKMHQSLKFGCGWGKRWGAYSAPPDLLAGFNWGPTSKGRGGSGGDGRGVLWSQKNP